MEIKKEKNFYLRNYKIINILIVVLIAAIISFGLWGLKPFINQFGDAFAGKGFFEKFIGYAPEVKFFDRIKNFFSLSGFKSVFSPVFKIFFNPIFLLLGIPIIVLIVGLRKTIIFRKIKLETEEDIKKHYEKRTVRFNLKLIELYESLKDYINYGLLYMWGLIKKRDEEGNLYIVKYGMIIILMILFFNGNLFLIFSDIITLVKQYFALIFGNVNTVFFKGLWGFIQYVFYNLTGLLTFWRLVFISPFIIVSLIIRNAKIKKAKQYEDFKKKIRDTPRDIHYIGEIASGKTFLSIATVLAVEQNAIDFFRQKIIEFEIRFKNVMNFKTLYQDFLDAFHNKKINSSFEAKLWAVNYAKNYNGKSVLNYVYNDYRPLGLSLEDQIKIWAESRYNLLLATMIHSNITVINYKGPTDELIEYIKMYDEPRDDLFLTVGDAEIVQRKRNEIIKKIKNDEHVWIESKILNIDIKRANQVGEEAYYLDSGVITFITEVDKENPSKDSDLSKYQDFFSQSATGRHEQSAGPETPARNVKDSQNFNASDAQTRGVEGFMDDIQTTENKRFLTIRILRRFVIKRLKKKLTLMKKIKEARDDYPYYLIKLENKAHHWMMMKDYLEQFDFVEYKLKRIEAYEGSPVKLLGTITYQVSLDNRKFYKTTSHANYFDERRKFTKLTERMVPHYSGLDTTPQEALLQNSYPTDNILGKLGIKVVDEDGILKDYLEVTKDRIYKTSQAKAKAERLKAEEKERLKLEKEKNK